MTETIDQLRDKLTEAHKEIRRLLSLLPFGDPTTTAVQTMMWLEEEVKQGARVEISADAWHPGSVGVHLRFEKDGDWSNSCASTVLLAIANMRDFTTRGEP